MHLPPLPLHRRALIGLGAATLGTRLLAADSPAGLPPCDPPPGTRLDYDVSGKASGFTYHAQGQLDWRRDAERYDARLTLSMPLLGSRVQTSEGRIGPDGLRPDRFADRRRNKERSASFERDEQRIRFSNQAPHAVLQPGAQDRLSLFLQLAGLLRKQPRAPGDGIEFQVVGTGDAENWRFVIGPLQPLALPAGTIEAVRIARAPRKPDDSRVELWLAPTLGHLPVRLRITQVDGDLADQRLSRWP